MRQLARWMDAQTAGQRIQKSRYRTKEDKKFNFRYLEFERSKE